MTPETVLMWSAALILAAIALAAAAFALWWAAVTSHSALNRWRVRGLTRAQIAECRALAAQFRMENGTSNGPFSPPVDPVNQPRWKPDTEESSR